MPVGHVITRRYYGLLHVYYAITSIHIIDYTYSNKQQTQLTYLSDSLKQPSNESECHVYTRDHFCLKIFNGAENGANFKFYITNQTDLENDTIRKGISI